jgi:hypothetical protein
MYDHRRSCCKAIAMLALGGALLFGVPVSVWALEAPTGKVILKISGRIGVTNVGQEAHFDLKMLEKLSPRSFSTLTPWDHQPIKFTGPLLRDVIAAVKGTGTAIQAVALNDYKVRIPLADVHAHDVIIAYTINDQAIPIRTKGPLFVIYPFDSKPELKSNTYYERSIWQLKALELQ